MSCRTRMKGVVQELLWLLLLELGCLLVVCLEPGYLDFDNLPDTNFSCVGKVIGGYYADLETNCQMFHVCTIGQLDEPMDIRFLCLNGTVFDQETRVCERIDEVDCSKSEKFYSLNLELYGNTQPPVLEEEFPVEIKRSSSTSTTSTTTTRRPTYTTPAPATTIRTTKVITAHHFPVANSPDIRFNPEEINISLNPGAPPDIIRSPVPVSFQQQSYSNDKNPRITVTTHTTEHKHDKPQRAPGPPVQNSPNPLQAGQTTQTPKSVVSYGLTHAHLTQPATPTEINYGFTYQPTEESVDYHTDVPPHPYQYQLSIANLRPPTAQGRPYHSSYHTTNKRPHKIDFPAPTTYRNHPAYSTSAKAAQEFHSQRTEKTPRLQLPLPLLPTLPPLTFSSPAPFSLGQHHIETKRYTNDHSSHPRIIISASASVSDNNGRRLNYSLGTIGASQIVGTSSSSYDDYKEDDVGLDPFYHDVPKIKSLRHKREIIQEDDVIKDEQEAADLLKFLFNWYSKREKRKKISIPVSSEDITEINRELAAAMEVPASEENANSLFQIEDNGTIRADLGEELKDVISEAHNATQSIFLVTAPTASPLELTPDSLITEPSLATTENVTLTTPSPKRRKGNRRRSGHFQSTQSTRKPRRRRINRPSSNAILVTTNKPGTLTTEVINLDYPASAENSKIEKLEHTPIETYTPEVTTVPNLNIFEPPSFQEKEVITTTENSKDSYRPPEEEYGVKDHQPTDSAEETIPALESYQAISKTDQIPLQSTINDLDYAFTTELSHYENVDSQQPSYEPDQSDEKSSHATKHDADYSEVKHDADTLQYPTQAAQGNEFEETTTFSETSNESANEKERINSTEDLAESHDVDYGYEYTTEYLEEPLSADSNRQNFTLGLVHGHENFTELPEGSKRDVDEATTELEEPPETILPDKQNGLHNNDSTFTKHLQYNLTEQSQDSASEEATTTEIFDDFAYDAEEEQHNFTYDELPQKEQNVNGKFVYSVANLKSTPETKSIEYHLIKKNPPATNYDYGWESRHKSEEVTASAAYEDEVNDTQTFEAPKEEFNSTNEPEQSPNDNINDNHSTTHPTKEGHAFPTTTERLNRKKNRSDRFKSSFIPSYDEGENSEQFEDHHHDQINLLSLGTSTHHTPSSDYQTKENIPDYVDDNYEPLTYEGLSKIRPDDFTTESQTDTTIFENLTEEKTTTDSEVELTTNDILTTQVETTTIWMPEEVTTTEPHGTTSSNVESTVDVAKPYESTTDYPVIYTETTQATIAPLTSTTSIYATVPSLKATTAESRRKHERTRNSWNRRQQSSRRKNQSRHRFGASSREPGYTSDVFSHINNEFITSRSPQTINYTVADNSSISSNFKQLHSIVLTTINPQDSADDALPAGPELANSAETKLEIPITDAPLLKSANPTKAKYTKIVFTTTPLSRLVRVELRKDMHGRRYTFNCFNKEIHQFYSDPRDCRLFHYCTLGYSRNQMVDMKFVCDLGTYFDDEKLICTKTKPARCL